MPFRVSRDVDMKCVAGFRADEGNQLIGITEFAGVGHAGGQVAAQGDDAADAAVAEDGQQFTNARLRCADARQMRRGNMTSGGNFADGRQRAFLRRTAGTISDGEKGGLEYRQPLACFTQFFDAFYRLRWKEFYGEFKIHT